MLKCCNVCQEEKPVTEYWVTRNGRTRDGLMGRCKECTKAKRREWAAQNREREQYHNRKRYESNREYYLAQTAQWQLDNPERAREAHRISEAARRARKHQAFIEDVDPATVYEMHGGQCGICKEFIEGDFHVDHRVPLAAGGVHGYVNVQPAHPICNLRKGARL